jgi:hypothetical protein
VAEFQSNFWLALKTRAAMTLSSKVLKHHSDIQWTLTITSRTFQLLPITVKLNKIVKQQCLILSCPFAGRPFGLNIAINYRDSNGAPFTEAVFNETVLITELDEGLDGETFFLYVFFAAIVVLLLVVGQQFLGTIGKKKRSQNIRKQVETGTSNNTDIDYEWLPAQTLRNLRKSILL